MKISRISWRDPKFGSKILESFQQTGFAVVTDHELDIEMLDNFYIEWTKFFTIDRVKNSPFYKANEHHAGFFPMDSEKAKDASVPDLKEFFHYYPSKIQDPAMGFSKLIYESLEIVAKQILHEVDMRLPDSIESGLSMPLPEMVEDSEKTLLRVLHYPAMKDVPQGAVRAAEHEDINLITILPGSTEMGLQVKSLDGSWVDVEANTKDLVVNVGDMLQEATGGYLRSTPHRVVNVGMNKPRLSAPLFLHPRPEVVLSEKYTAKEYLTERLIQLGLIKE